MIQNPTQFNNICDDIINNSIETLIQNEDVFNELIQKYIKQLDTIIKENIDWDIFNMLLNKKINDNTNPNFSGNVFTQLYALIFYYFKEKLGAIKPLEVQNLVTVSSIFDERNIVEEKVWSVKINDDILQQGPPVDTAGILAEFKQLEDSAYFLQQKTFLDADKGNDNIDTMPADTVDNDTTPEEPEENKSRTSPHVITATFKLKKAVDDMGRLFMNGSTCPVCGKRVRFMPSNGFCSINCALQDLLVRVRESLTGEYVKVSEKVQKKIDLIKEILDYINLSINLFAKLPDVLAGIMRLPEEYKNYAIQKINIVFLSIKKIINKLLIFKNKLIISLLKRIKFGTIDQKVQKMLEPINEIIQLVNMLKQKLNDALSVAIAAITKLNGQFYIGPQEYGFFMPLKSLVAPCPYFKTDATVYPPEQLGRPYWGPSVFNVAFDMSKCQLSLDIGIKSALQNRDFKKINSIIKKVFLPIGELEYLMDPDLFDVRLALSDQNAPTIQKLVMQLQKVVVLGGDFIPSYDNLSLTNIWYIIAILSCWGPWTRAVFGDFLIHGMYI